MSKINNSQKLGLILGSAAFVTTGCAPNLGQNEEKLGDFSVTQFHYDKAQHIGQITASEVITPRVTNKQAEKNMESTLYGSGAELGVFFPNVPQDLRAGNFTCQVTNYDSESSTFVFNCVAVAIGKSI